MKIKKIIPILLSVAVGLTPIQPIAATYDYEYDEDTPSDETGSTENYDIPDDEVPVSDTTYDSSEDPDYEKDTETNDVEEKDTTVSGTTTNKATTEGTVDVTTIDEKDEESQDEEVTFSTKAVPSDNTTTSDGTINFSQLQKHYTTENNEQTYFFSYSGTKTLTNANITFTADGDMQPYKIYLGDWQMEKESIPLSVIIETKDGQSYSVDATSNSTVNLSNYGLLSKIIINANESGVYNIQGISLTGYLTSDKFSMTGAFNGFGDENVSNSQTLDSDRLFYNLENPVLKVSKNSPDNTDSFSISLSGINGKGSANMNGYRVAFTIPSSIDIEEITLPTFENAEFTATLNGEEITGDNLSEKVDKRFVFNILPTSDEFTQSQDFIINAKNNVTEEETVYLNATGIAEFINYQSVQTQSNTETVVLKGPVAQPENPDQPDTPTPVVPDEPDEPIPVQPDEPTPSDDEKEDKDNKPETKPSDSSEKTKESSETPSSNPPTPVTPVPLPTEEEDTPTEEKKEEDKKKKKEKDVVKNNDSTTTPTTSDLVNSVMGNTTTLVNTVSANIDTDTVEDVEEDKLEEDSTLNTENNETTTLPTDDKSIPEKTKEIVKKNRGAQIAIITGVCAVIAIGVITIVMKKMNEEDDVS